MKLIAETEQESQLLDGLSALLCDLGIDVDSYERNDAIAVTFLSPNNFLVPDQLNYMTEQQQTSFLYSIEDALRSAMLDSGYRTISKALRRGKRISHPDQYLT